MILCSVGVRVRAGSSRTCSQIQICFENCACGGSSATDNRWTCHSVISLVYSKAVHIPTCMGPKTQLDDSMPDQFQEVLQSLSTFDQLSSKNDEAWHAKTRSPKWTKMTN